LVQAWIMPQLFDRIKAQQIKPRTVTRPGFFICQIKQLLIVSLARGLMNPAFLFTASPGDVGPVAFSFYHFDAGSLFQPVTDFTFWLEMNGMRFIEE